MGLGILALSALISLQGLLQIPSQGQGKQFYCRRGYEPERQLGRESVAHSIWGLPRKGPTRISTQPLVVPLDFLCTSLACRNTSAERDIYQFQTRHGLGGGSAGGGAHGARAQSGGRVRDRGPRSGAERWGPGRCGSERSRHWDHHNLAGHELGTRAPDTPDTLQHRRHPRSAHSPPRILCVTAS